MVTTAFQIASEFVDDLCALDPVLATQLGVPGRDDAWGDGFGLDGVEQAKLSRTRYRQRVLPFLGSEDPRERLAARVMVGSFDEEDDEYESGDHFRTLRHLASPFHQIRSVFDVMKTDTDQGRENIVRRLDTVDRPLQDYRRLLEQGQRAGITVGARQVRSVAAQARRLANDPASIDQIVSRAAGGAEPSPRLVAAAEGARAAYRRFADWLETAYLPDASDREGVGMETYSRSADRHVGRKVDPSEAYAWGWEEFHRLLGEMARVAELIRPGEGVEEAKHYLETDPSVTATGTGDLLRFVERTLSEAVDDLSGSHFVVPAEIRPLTVQLAPPGSPLGVYYRSPSEDFSRPGGVWYSIGDQRVFPLYQHVSTAYHEGFPGHHLQNATAMYHRERTSRFQRLLTWCPGYGEGWAMYAEVLMGELGYLEEPQHYFGMLAKQMYRAARVVVDIGLHLSQPIPAQSPLFPGEEWTFDKAVEFMRVYGFRTSDQARDEVLRYLGWPGQAISYKLGEREILEIRDESRRSLGDRFDLRKFHSTLIENGAMRLDLLRAMIAEGIPG